MKLQVKYFGMIAEAVGKTEEELNIDGDCVSELTQFIISLYPSLKEFNFKIAVNQNVVGDDFTLSDNQEVALLPPFAGG